MTTQQLVTTFTLCYHTKAELVIAAIDSIYNQTYKNIEHIIINDAPDDNIEWPKIKKHIIDKGYKSTIIEHTKNQGITKNLNEITNHAKGKYICGCSDDLWEPTYIEKQVDFFEHQSEDIAVVFADLNLINEQGTKIGEITFNSSFEINRNETNLQLQQLLKKNFVFAPAAIWKRNAVLAVNKYLENLYAEDYQMWFKLLLNGYRITFNNIKESNYRSRAGAISNKYESSGRMALDRCRLFHQTQSMSTSEQWKLIEPFYYKFVKKVVGHPEVAHKFKFEVANYALKDLKYHNKYLIWLIVLFKLYNFKLFKLK